MPSWTRSLQFRLTIGFALILSAALLTVSAYASTATQRELNAFSIELAEARAERLNQLVSELHEEDGDWSKIQIAIEQAARLYDWRVLLEDTAGHVVADSHFAFTREPLYRQRFYQRPLVIQGKELGNFAIEVTNASLAYMPGQGNPSAFRTGRTANGGGLSTFTVADAEISGSGIGDDDRTMAAEIQEPKLSRLATSFNRSLFWAGLSAGMAGILVVAFSTKQALRPLRDLSTAAASLAAGDLSHRVNTASGGEVGALGHAFNDMARSLEAGESERRRVVADIAHELRSPLTNIQGYLEAIKDGIVEPDPETIDTIYSQTKHLGTLVEDLRLLALVEAGSLRLDVVRTDLPTLVLDAVEAFRPRATDRGVNLTFAQYDDLPPCGVDPTRLRQVVSNLVENAITHTPDGGSVTVEVSRTETAATMQVRDAGDGIPPEALPHVFDRFYRVDLSRDRTTGGAGLGLTIVKRLVELHGGAVYVESEPGNGSVFTVELPFTAAPLTSAAD